MDGCRLLRDGVDDVGMFTFAKAVGGSFRRVRSDVENGFGTSLSDGRFCSAAGK